MNNIEQAYLDGFFKRAAAYGLSLEEAAGLFEKSAAPQGSKALAVKPAPAAPAAPAPTPAPAKPMVGEGDKNDRAASMGNYVPKPLPNPKTIPLEW